MRERITATASRNAGSNGCSGEISDLSTSINVGIHCSISADSASRGADDIHPGGSGALRSSSASQSKLNSCFFFLEASAGAREAAACRLVQGLKSLRAAPPETLLKT
eukprot:3461132-Pleurochrysis_carterae.AAC.1